MCLAARAPFWRSRLRVGWQVRAFIRQLWEVGAAVAPLILALKFGSRKRHACKYSF